MKNLKEISAEIQELCVQNFSDTEALKDVFNLLKDIENRKTEVIKNISDLAEDFNQMARQIDAEPINDKEDLEKIINGSAFAAKRDGVRTCLKMIEEL